jgi:hypothetical protein
VILKIHKILILALFIGCLFIQQGYCDDGKYVLIYSDANTKEYLDSTKIHQGMEDLIPNRPFLYYDVWIKKTSTEDVVQGYINNRKLSGQSIEGYEKFSYSLWHSIYALSPAQGSKRSQQVLKNIERIDYDLDGNILSDKTFDPEYIELLPNTIGIVILFNTANYCLENHIH